MWRLAAPRKPRLSPWNLPAGVQTRKATATAKEVSVTAEQANPVWGVPTLSPENDVKAET